MRSLFLAVAGLAICAPAYAGETVEAAQSTGFVIDNYANPSVIDITFDPVTFQDDGTDSPATNVVRSQSRASEPVIMVGGARVSIAPPRNSGAGAD